MSAYRVYKFGGSSLANVACFRQVASLVEQADSPNLAVVVSAMGGMTDSLLRLVSQAESGDDAFEKPLASIASRYERTAGSLLEDLAQREQVLNNFHADIDSLRDVLKAITLVRAAPERSQDLIAGFGEIWSSRLLSALLAARSPAVRWLDAREALTIKKTKLGPSVQWDTSAQRLADTLPEDFSGVVVITGFVASDENGLHATLGRNGSDFSASIFAALLQAEELTIWTDVDGVLSADPRKVPDAEIIRSVSYNEAMELAYFGAKVIHPQTMGPAVARGIPILIRNTFDPTTAYTTIGRDSGRDQPIKGITSIDGLALVSVEGAGMIGVPGTADRLFGALNQADVSVVLISQASSEHSICFAVPAGVAELAVDAVKRAFAAEIADRQIQRVECSDGMSIVAVVGDGMSGLPGVAGRFLNTLGKAGINVAAIAQGSSERNISVVLASDDTTAALRAVHSGFYLSAKTLSVGVIGPGTVGATLLSQLHAQIEALRLQFNLELRVRAIASSKKMLLAKHSVDLGDWQSALHSESQSLDLVKFAEHVNADHLPHAVIVDCTADTRVSAQYAAWARQGIHIVTPNKKAFSAPQPAVTELRAALEASGTHCLYETTVGAGLPIINTLRDLVGTGDRVRSIEGIFSGTLAYLFNTYDGTEPFSEIVAAAREQGFTEPDPRDDLSGMDVARKVVILSRELGMDVELDDLQVQSLVPPELADLSVDEFMRELPRFDDDMRGRAEAARSGGRQLRYVGSIDTTSGPSVELREVDADHPFANINLTDNVVQFVTERYNQNPLVIQGPGAGPDVTAGGIFADILRVAEYLGEGS